MKKAYKKYLEPDDVDSFDRDEITSHSSLLTNRRLDIMFARLDEVRVESWNNPCVPTIREYFSILGGIFNNVYPIFEPDENQKIKDLFDSFHKGFFSVYEDNPLVNKYQLCYKLLFILDQVQRIIIGNLQKRQFFFRLGKQQIKGIEQALKMYEKKREKVKK